jgi:hypothetical protein
VDVVAGERRGRRAVDEEFCVDDEWFAVGKVR